MTTPSAHGSRLSQGRYHIACFVRFVYFKGIAPLFRYQSKKQLGARTAVRLVPAR